jgi:hypothetical protein
MRKHAAFLLRSAKSPRKYADLSHRDAVRKVRTRLSQRTNSPCVRDQRRSLQTEIRTESREYSLWPKRARYGGLRTEFLPGRAPRDFDVSPRTRSRETPRLYVHIRPFFARKSCVIAPRYAGRCVFRLSAMSRNKPINLVKFERSDRFLPAPRTGTEAVGFCVHHAMCVTYLFPSASAETYVDSPGLHGSADFECPMGRRQNSP